MAFNTSTYLLLHNTSTHLVLTKYVLTWNSTLIIDFYWSANKNVSQPLGASSYNISTVLLIMAHIFEEDGLLAEPRFI